MIKNRRKKYIVARGLQFRYVGVILFAMILVALLVGWTVYWHIWNALLLEAKSTGYLTTTHLYSIMKKADVVIITTLAILIIAISIISVFISHRIAGPIFRLKKYMPEVGRGDLTFQMRIRRGDELSDLVEEFNKMVASLRSLITQDKETIFKIMAKAEESLIILNTENISVAERAKAGNNLKELIIQAKEIMAKFKV